MITTRPWLRCWPSGRRPDEGQRVVAFPHASVCYVASRRRTSGQSRRPLGRGYFKRVTTTPETDGAPAEDAEATATAELNLNAPLESEATPAMADGNNGTFYSPYPGVFSQGGGDDGGEAYKAALITQGDASTQRNQDSQFAAQRDQLIHRDVESTKRETAQAKYDLAVQAKDGEVRAAERFAVVASELAALRAKMDADTIATLRVEVSETKAEGRQSKTESLLATILAKLPV